MPDLWRPENPEHEARNFWRVLITGSRTWPEPRLVRWELDVRLGRHGNLCVVHGDCPTGADLYARQWAEEMIAWGMEGGTAHVRHEPYPALWERFGKPAGPKRNAYMVNLGADECLAFPTAESRGTIGCMDLARAAGIPIVNLGTKDVY